MAIVINSYGKYLRWYPKEEEELRESDPDKTTNQKSQHRHLCVR